MPDPGEYSVGWIAAIDPERTAAVLSLDEEHDPPEFLSPQDSNDYTLGRIGRHNVVIAWLPPGEYGTTSASDVAIRMAHSFPNLRFGLMVGVAGGAPSAKNDIRLGDVIVSQPDGIRAGVINYDFGKSIQKNSTFTQTGFLCPPPKALQKAAGGLASRHKIYGHGLQRKVDKILESFPHLKGEFARPPADSDRLYKADYMHQDDQKSCFQGCGDHPDHLVTTRRNRAGDLDEFAVHYGLIASSNRLIRDAHLRDKWVAQEGVLCFEMEAAGMMSNFPCLVIRGICDYSDSHKNKEWQGFAAMMAAAYAKDLLLRLIPSQVQMERKLVDIIGIVERIERKVDGIQQDSLAANAALRSLESDARVKKVKTWLSPADPSTNASRAAELCHPGTGSWLMENSTFREWLDGSRRHIWLHGPTGCGKTVISARLFSDLSRGVNADQLLLNFFFDFSDTKKQTVNDMLRSFVFQAYLWQIRFGDDHGSILEPSDCQPTNTVLWDKLRQILAGQQKVYVLLDALDESAARWELVNWIKDLVARPGLQHVQLICISRPEPEFLRCVPTLIGKDNCLALDETAINHDIRSYITARLAEDQRFVGKLPEDLVQQITIKLGDKANGMFRWAYCQMESLAKCVSPLAITETLEKLPLNLAETYDRMMESIPRELRQDATRLLRFLIHYKRPLRSGEAMDVIATWVETEPRAFDRRRRPFDTPTILQYCPGLIVLRPSRFGSEIIVQLAHLSVEEYLVGQPEFSPKAAATSTLWTCVTYLDAVEPGNGWDECSRTHPPIIFETFPLVHSAWQCWTEHRGEPEPSDEMVKASLGFLGVAASQPHLYFWDIDRRARRFVRRLQTSLAVACCLGLTRDVELLLDGPDAPTQIGDLLKAASALGRWEIVRFLEAEIVQGNMNMGRRAQRLLDAGVRVSWLGFENIGRAANLIAAWRQLRGYNTPQAPADSEADEPIATREMQPIKFWPGNPWLRPRRPRFVSSPLRNEITAGQDPDERCRHTEQIPGHPSRGGAAPERQESWLQPSSDRANTAGALPAKKRILDDDLGRGSGPQKRRK